MPDDTNRQITLSDLGLGPDRGDTIITGISLDSRTVRDGHLFAALPGTRVHGAEFVSYALRMGAAAILTDAEGHKIAQEVLADTQAAVVVADVPGRVFSQVCARYFGAQPETMVAVTGTNGKTSVASFCRQIWTECEMDAANIGTTGIEGAFDAPLNHTTPDALTLHRLLARMAGAGVTHAAMEASSHGLAQYRLDGVCLNAVGFTNFTQDHLDYHASFDDYMAAKVGLFERVAPDAPAVLNVDDPEVAGLAARLTKDGRAVLRVGASADADLRIMAQRFDEAGQTVRFSWNGKAHQTHLPLVGGFQAANALLACGLLIAAGLEADQAFAALSKLTGVRGRMQLAATRSNGAGIYVDYAHTPDALKTALAALRPHVLGRLIVVFGAGGDRDARKRPLMGQAAAQGADVVFVTDDNPRSEDPGLIRQAVLAGCPGATEVADRAEAILRAVDAAGAGDIVLIAGKGHEAGQIVGDQVYPFDDVEQASVAAAALEGRIS